MLEKQLLNKIKWDKKLNPADYTITYLDYGKKEHTLNYNDITEWEGRDMKAYVNNKLVSIPIFCIRKILKRGKVIWTRT